jgi:two-component system, cell cycle sensor histidine kinase and response regulator CckA
MDITTKHAALGQEMQLKLSQEVTDAILTHLPCFVIVADHAGKVLYANQAASDVFGFDSSLIPQMSLADLIPAVSPKTGQMQIALNTNGRWNGECRIVGRAQTELSLELSAARIEGNTPDERIYLISGHDVTAQRCGQRQNCQFEKLSTRGEMAGEISHEMNNYLSIIMGNLELLGMGIAKGNIEALAPRVKSMRDGLDRVVKYIEGLMSIGRPEVTFKEVDLREQIENEVFYLRHEPRFKGIEFIYEWDDSIPRISVVQNRLQQALYNIFTNACEAMIDLPAGQKRITISASLTDKGEFVRLDIRDNGCGMGEEDYQKLFRQLFTTKGTGHGFGLLSIKGAIKSQGGKISAAPAPGGGACFTIELPIQNTMLESRKATVPA